MVYPTYENRELTKRKKMQLKREAKMKVKKVDEEEDKKWLVKLLQQIDGYEYS